MAKASCKNGFQATRRLVFSFTMSFDADTPRRILVRAPNWLGDHIMAGTFYRALRARYPSAHLALLCRENVAGVDYGSVFDEVRVHTRAETSLSRKVLATAASLRQEEYDLALSLPASLSSAVLLALAGIPNRVGFAEGAAEGFLTHSVPWLDREGGVHKSQLYLSLLDVFGERPLVPPPLPQTNNRRENLIVVAPGAANPLREWPRYTELLLELRRRYWAFRIVVVGSAGEAKWHSILKRLGNPGVVDWVERTTLPELVALCRRAKLVVSNDSGAAHVAATLAGAPTVVIFGPGDPAYIRPLGPAHVVRREDLACSPCESAQCKGAFGYQACLKELALEPVLAKVSSLLSN
jgi:heptosyltransferase II